MPHKSKLGQRYFLGRAEALLAPNAGLPCSMPGVGPEMILGSPLANLTMVGAAAASTGAWLTRP